MGKLTVERKGKLTVERKIDILKEAKIRLNEIGNKNNDSALCIIIRSIITENDEICPTSPSEKIQEEFNMNICRPANDPANDWLIAYWWNFDEAGYQSRQKALDTLIEYWNSKK